jgi:hypothetical protein
MTDGPHQDFKEVIFMKDLINSINQKKETFDNESYLLSFAKGWLLNESNMYPKTTFAIEEVIGLLNAISK